MSQETKPLFDNAINPDLYMMRPGDQLEVSFINSNLKSIKLTINPESNIIHETIGLIDVKGKSLSETKTILLTILKKLYMVENISISITEPRPISIAVYGAVRRPGFYQAISSERVSSVIDKAGGITDDGSLRNILFTGGVKELVVDLDKAENLGDHKSNPYLYAGNTIVVPGKIASRVQVIGEVNKPREIELLETDTYETLIALAGGFNQFADKNKIVVIRGNKQIGPENIQPDDIIKIYQKTDKQNIVSIFGAVTNPGIYDFTNGLTVTELINQAGGNQTDANLSLLTVFRKPRVDLEGHATTLRYPISKPVSESDSKLNSINLQPNDSVFVPIKVGFVRVTGEVLNPGYFPYKNSGDASYYITNAGGYTPKADKSYVLIFNPVSKLTTKSSSSVIVNDGVEIQVELLEELK